MAAEGGGGMQKKQVWDYKDTNVALLGSDLDKKCRVAAAEGEKAWVGAGEKAGILIWRIEQFKVVKSKTPAGTFYSDDSYICLVTKADKENPDKLRHDIHFWLGSTTSQDEAGTAAYKTVELDDLLGGEPVQHREVCGHESKAFIKLFPDGIRLLEGGVASGFNHVKPEEYTPRLLHVKGRKAPRVMQVEKKASSMNNGDVFILDAGMKIYQWNGKSAGMMEKNRASVLCRAIDDERGGKPEVTVYTQGDKDEDEFWELLGDKPDGELPDEDAAGDEKHEVVHDKALFRLSDAGGEMTFEKCATIGRDELKSEDVFIFDVGNEIFTWIGKGASKEEKNQAITRAQDYLCKDENRPNWLPITRVFEAGENEVFNSHLE